MEECSEIVRQQSEPGKEFELGTWLGRRQAFGAMASRCSAADAECLRKIRQEKLFKASGVEWPEFCRRYLGMGRANADRLIRILEQFGPNYFRLAEIVRLEHYRLIAGAVKAEGLEFGGETIPLVPENSPRLAEAVQALRRDAGQAEEPARPRCGARDLAGIHKRLEELVADLHSLAQSDQCQAARALAEHGRLEFTRVSLGLHQPGVGPGLP